MRTAQIFLLLVVVVVSGCTTELYHGLDERSANEMVMVLDRSGIEADKTVDPIDASRWAVTVPRGVRVEAWEILARRGLPRPEVQGFDAFYPRDSLVPTADEERIILQYSTSQELRRAILAIDSVVDAHVNLVLPEKPRVRLSNATVVPPRASVLVRFRDREDGEAPVTAEAVKTLVAGGVEGLQPEAVEVLLTRADLGGDEAPSVEMASVGPVSVAARSKFALQAFVGGLILVMFGLAGALVFVVVRRGGPRV